MTAVMTERQTQTLTMSAGRDELAEALTYVGALAISSRCVLPILGGVKITAASGVATVEAFDYETHAVQVIAATGEGCALIPQAALLNIVKGCDKGARLTLEATSDTITLSDGEATFTLPPLALDEYPQGPLPGAITLGTLTPDMLSGVAATLPAAGRDDDTLPVLTGVCFDPSGTWHAATTDRYRLVTFDTGIPAAADAARVLVPARTVQAVCKRLKGAVTVTYTIRGYDEGNVTFSDGTRTVTARTLYGEFPKYKAPMPTEYAATLVVDAKRAVKATKRAALVCTRTSPVVIQLDSDGATITAGKDFDDARASVPAGGDYTGEAMSVGVNPAYLLDMLAGIGSDSVTVGFVASVKPFVAWDADRPALRWLQMPVRLS